MMQTQSNAAAQILEKPGSMPEADDSRFGELVQDFMPQQCAAAASVTVIS
jgi:hypothetical protein